MKHIINSLFLRLALLGSLGSCISVFILGFYVAYDQAQLGYETAIQEAHLISQGLASSISEALILKDYGSIEAKIKQTTHYPNIVNIQVINANNIKIADATFNAKNQQWLFLYGETVKNKPTENHSISTIENNRIITWIPVIPNKNLGWIKTDLSLDSVIMTNQKIIAQTCLIGIFSVMFSVFVIIFALRKPVKEIKQATQFALCLPKNFGELLFNNATTNEIQLLISALNNASLTLQLQDKKIKVALAEANDFKKAMDQIDAYIYMKDKNYNYVYANQSTLKLFNCSLDQLIGQDDFSLFAKHSAEKIRITDKKIIEEKQNSREEVNSILLNGKQYSFLDIKTPIFNIDDDSTAWGLCGISYDITENKRIEAELSISAVAFESQEGILITDNRANILRVNSAFTKITGYSAHEIIGQNLELFKSDKHDENFYTLIKQQVINTGSWKGEIWSHRKNTELYPAHLTITAVKNIKNEIINFVTTLTDITLAKEAAEKIEKLAYFDPLTGLPNRRLLLDRLEHALEKSYRHRSEGALLFLDLDKFKLLNDTLGHEYGDLLLQEVAHRLKTCVRKSDTVARLGGDEFVVLLENLNRQDINAAREAELVAHKILETLNMPYLLNTKPYQSTPSIGVTLFDQALDYKSLDEILKQADIAMYQAKNAGRNAVRFFDPIMEQALKNRVKLENALFKALENGEIELFYQIQVDHHHQPLGAEALIRWHHPEFGMTLPNIFIPIAEQSGHINVIGHWVLETACQQLEKWHENPLTKDLVLSINVSAKQFHQADFINQINSVITRYQIKPLMLKFELTESMLLNNADEVISTMQQLKDMGIEISLDDFGTGYSCLQYLKKLPISQLKIDGCFVRDIALNKNDAAIAKTIIAMTETLELNVIAEGVETLEQFDILVEKGCTHFQGYLFGKPKPINEFEASLVGYMKTE